MCIYIVSICKQFQWFWTYFDAFDFCLNISKRTRENGSKPPCLQRFRRGSRCYPENIQTLHREKTARNTGSVHGAKSSKFVLNEARGKIFQICFKWSNTSKQPVSQWDLASIDSDLFESALSQFKHLCLQVVFGSNCILPSPGACLGHSWEVVGIDPYELSVWLA